MKIQKLLSNFKEFYSPNFQTFLEKDFISDDSEISFIYIAFFSIITLINLIVIHVIGAMILDTIISILLVLLSLLVAYFIKISGRKMPTRSLSILLLILQILMIIQFEETYLKMITNNSNHYFPCIELRLLLSTCLLLIERNLFYKLSVLCCQLLILAIRTQSFDTPWLYFNYLLFAFILILIDLQTKIRFHKCYEKNKQLKTWSFLINKVLPFGYMVIGLVKKEAETTCVTLLGFNNFMKRIFEIDDREPNTSEKLLSLLKNNNINKGRNLNSYMSIEDRRSNKSLLSYIVEKLEYCMTKREKNDEEYIVDEIYQQEIVYKDGKAKALDIILIHAIINSKPSILLIINDISDRVLNFKLTNLDRFKDRFLQSVSHNLKTPLNSITGLISIMHNLVINTEILNYLNNIRVNSEILLFEINNMLDYANYRKNTLKPIITSFSISSLLNELSTIFEISLFEKRLKLTKKLKIQHEELQMFSDYTRLKQILFNIMSNSIKFTFEGHITISVSKPKNLAVPADLLKFSIKDTGIGISAADQEKLFRLWGSLHDEFLDSNDPEPQNSRSGAGLGLTISKHLIGLLGPEEKVYIKSNIGEGSVFSFYVYQDLNSENIKSLGQKKKIEVIPSYDSSNISFNKMTLNSQKMLGSAQFFKGDALGFPNFSSYLSHIRSPNGKLSVGAMRTSIKKKEGRSPSSFSPKIKKRSGSMNNDEIFDENVCIINKIYTEDMKKMSLGAKTNTAMERSSAFKINLINVRRSSSLKEISIESFSDKSEILSKKIEKNVLIVDDTPFNVLVLEKFIQEIEPTTNIQKAFNGKEAVGKVKEQWKIEKKTFDLIFMDCNMPEMDGYEASMIIKQMHEDEHMQFCPIIAVTAYSGKDEINKCLENKMDDYIGKPVNKEKFQEFYLKWSNKNYGKNFFNI